MWAGARQGFDLSGAGPYYARAMGNPLQDRRTAAEFASSGQLIEFADKISSFEGLAAVVEADLAALDPDKIPTGWRDSAISGRLEFGFLGASGGVPTVSGSATANVDAVCQRCLEPFRLTLSVEPNLLLLESEQTDEGFEGHEVWELEAAMLRPQDIVEELLIMAMPFSAMHDKLADCRAFQSDDLTNDARSDDSAEDLTKPFAALRSQMTQDEKDSD